MSAENSVLHRPSGPWHRTVLWAAVPGAVAAAAWITAGRALFGAGGSLVPVFAVSFGPLLLVVLLVAAWFGIKDARRHSPGTGTSTALAVLHPATWVLAFIFGMLCPDRVDGRTVSAASQLLGHEFVGLSAGFGNTFGILTFVAAFATLLVAISQARRSARRATGITEADEEEFERSQSSYEFLD